MPTKVVVELTSDEEKLLAGFRRAETADARMREKLGLTGEVGEKAAKEFTHAWVSGTKASTQGVNKMLRELRRSGPEGKAAADAIDDKMRQVGSNGRRSIGQIIDRIGDIDDAAGKAGSRARAEFRGMSKAVDGAVGDKAVNKISAFGAQWLSVTKATDLVAMGLRLVQERNESALASLQGTNDGDRRLLQISEGSEDFAKLRDTADNLSIDFGIDREKARNLVFSGRSESFEESLRFIAENAPSVDVEAQAIVAGQVPGLFKNETISPEQAINSTLVAAKESRLNFEQIAKSLPSAAASSATAGSSSAETLGALSVLAGRFKSGEQAADRISALAAKINLDKGVSQEEIEKNREKEVNRVASAKKSFRSLTERRDDIKKDLATEKSTDAKSRSEHEAKTKRIASLETRLQRADRAVGEFDQASLKAKPKSFSDAKRQGLDGLGLMESVRRLSAEFTDEERKDFLGESKELNEAYEVLLEEIGEVGKRIKMVEKAQADTGTSSSPVAMRRRIVEGDERSMAQIELKKSENKKEIETEDRRAVYEANRQTGVNKLLAKAEKDGVSKLRIANTERAASVLAFSEAVTGDGATEAVLPFVVGNPLSNLERDLASASASGDLEARSALLAAQKLGKRREGDSDAVLSQQEVADFMNGTRANPTPENFVYPGSVTEGNRVKLTNRFTSLANEAPGALSTIAGGFYRGEQSSRGKAFADELTKESSELAEAMNRQTAVLERQNQILEQQTTAIEESSEANKKTEKNTRPRQMGMAEAQRQLASRPPKGQP